MRSVIWVAVGVGATLLGVATGLAFGRDASLVAIPGERYVGLLALTIVILIGAAGAAVRLPSGRGALIGAATFAGASLALAGALSGYLLAPDHRSGGGQNTSATGSATVRARFEGSLVRGGDDTSAVCHSRPGSKEVGEIVAGKLGDTTRGSLQAVLIPLAPDTDLQLWVETDLKQQVVWITRPEIELRDPLGTSGRAAFTDARLAEDVDPDAWPDGPRTLSGTIDWACGPWEPDGGD
jgi:hypothetical protein